MGTAAPPDQIIVRDYLVLQVLLPIALLTILIVTVIVILGVVVCVQYGKRVYRRAQKHGLHLDLVTPLTQAHTLRNVDNFEIYTAPSHG